MRFLRDRTAFELHDKGEWFYAVYRSGSAKPGILFRAEMDAVPVGETCAAGYSSLTKGVGHQCGHDGHCAALLAAALQLEEDGAPCDVYLLFQHAEEIGEGAPVCVEILKNEAIGAFYGFHNCPGLPWGEVSANRSGTAYYASRGMIISLKGKPSHASMPEMGINPSFAIAELIREISAIKDASAFATIVGISAGAHAFGTQAGTGELCLTVRAESDEGLQQLQEQLEAKIVSLSKRDQLDYTIAFCDDFPATIIDAKCSAIVEKVCGDMGIPFQYQDSPDRSSDDLGWYTKSIPGTVFFVGDGENYPELHTSDFDFPDPLLPLISTLILHIIKEQALNF